MGTGRQLLAALALGADGMLMGSRMTVAQEIWAHDDYKRHVAAASQTDTQVVMSIFNDNSRVLDNETARKVLALEAEGIDDFEQYRPLVQGTNQRRAYETGDWQLGTPSMGQSCAFADDIKSVEAIFDEILADAAAHRDRLQTLARA
jgi:nitronate monooxygenase